MIRLLLLVCLLLLAPAPAAAYIGPGAGISVVGTALAFIGAVVFAILGFVWYPLKRLRAALRSRADRAEDEGRNAPAR